MDLEFVVNTLARQAIDKDTSFGVLLAIKTSQCAAQNGLVMGWLRLFGILGCIFEAGSGCGVVLAVFEQEGTQFKPTVGIRLGHLWARIGSARIGHSKKCSQTLFCEFESLLLAVPFCVNEFCVFDPGKQLFGIRGSASRNRIVLKRLSFPKPS